MEDLNFYRLFAVTETFLLILLLAAMLYFSFACMRRRGGWWPRILGGAVLVRLLVLGASVFDEVFHLWGSGGSSPRLTPNLPVTVETWFLIGGVLAFLAGLSELVAGGALIIGGWRESRRRKGGKKAR